MTSSTLASALALLGAAGGFGLLGLLIGRDLDRNSRHGRDNWHRPGGYPVDPSLPDRLHGPTPTPTAPVAHTALPSTAAEPEGDTTDRLRDTLSATSDLRFGRLSGWTS